MSVPIIRLQKVLNFELFILVSYHFFIHIELLYLIHTYLFFFFFSYQNPGMLANGQVRLGGIKDENQTSK